jgi:hypothetical protein
VSLEVELREIYLFVYLVEMWKLRLLNVHVGLYPNSFESV